MAIGRWRRPRNTTTRRCWRHRVRRHLVSRRRLLGWVHDGNAAVVVFGVDSFTAAILLSAVADSRPHRSVAAETSVLVDPQDVVSLSRVCRGPSLAMSQIATPCRRIPIAAGLGSGPTRPPGELDADWRESDADRFKFCIFGALKPRAIGTGIPRAPSARLLLSSSRPPTWGLLRTCI